MNVIYATEPFHQDYLCNPSIFLAGPTPRTHEVASWRPEMIRTLERLSEGVVQLTVFSPEPRDGIWRMDYTDQVEWEDIAISACTVLMFWIPRDVAGGMPGFTTNVEFGFWLTKKKRIVYGRPENSDKNKYLDWRYNKEFRGGKVHNTVEDTARAAIDMYPSEGSDPYTPLTQSM